MPAPTSRKSAAKSKRKWSAKVTRTSDAMTLERHVFATSPIAIVRSLKRSVDRSHRRKAGLFQSAISMLNFYINRGGKNLSATQKKKLTAAKDELRKVFGRKPAAA